MKLYASTRPDLSTVYTHASFTVLGWAVSVMFCPVSWDIPNFRPEVGVIGHLPDGWRWQTVRRNGAPSIDLYRFEYSGADRREERKPWLEVAHAAV